MSLITDDPDDSPRHCKQLHHHHLSRSSRRRALIFAAGALASLLSLALILCLTLRPASDPRFALLAATATATHNDNDNATLLLDAAFAARNPNAHASALYDRLQLAVASYAGAPLAAAAAPLPPLDQLPQDEVVLSASLSSPLPPAAAADAAVAGAGGRALLRLRLEGQLRWKLATWVSGRHALTVDCVATLLLQPSPTAVVGVVQGVSHCATTLR